MNNKKLSPEVIQAVFGREPANHPSFNAPREKAQWTDINAAEGRETAPAPLEPNIWFRQFVEANKWRD